MNALVGRALFERAPGTSCTPLRWAGVGGDGVYCSGNLRWTDQREEMRICALSSQHPWGSTKFAELEQCE